VIYEIRTYTFVPGRMQIWLEVFQRVGYPILVQYVGTPMLSAISEVGPLNQLVQVFGYSSFEDRDQRRASLLADEGFRKYVKESGELGCMQSQDCQILKPAFA